MVHRWTPGLPTQAMKTYSIMQPIATHWRAATCAEVGCGAYLNGWRTRVEGLSPQLLHTARTSGRTFTELHVAPGETWLVFEAGQACFAATKHRVPVGRDPIFVVRGGDWRGNPRQERRRHVRPEDWVDDFATHQQRLADRLARG